MNNNENEMNDMTFEDAISRLSEIVSSLEGQGSTLDASLALFEEGIALVKLCNKRIENAEQRVLVLTGDDYGEGNLMREVPFNED